ncbi:MAG: adenylate/guanylate cyclase domain-containing protein [Pseudomonadota bacterium]
MGSSASEDKPDNQLLINPTRSLGRAGRIRRFLKTANLLLIGLGLLWGCFAFSQSHWALFFADIVLLSIGLGAQTLLRFKKLVPAIHSLLIALLLWVIGVAYFISGSGVNHHGAAHYWLIVYIVALNFVLFGAATLLQTTYIAVAILVFVVIEYDLVSLNPAYGFPSHDTLFSHGLTLGLVLIAISILMRTYIRELGSAEERARVATFRANALLQSVLPPSVAQKVQRDGKTYTERADNCSILFADIVGFTELSDRLSADELVALLNNIFSRFDQLCVKHGVEKIKTIGDGYLAVCGIPKADSNHAENILALAIDMQDTMNDFDELSIRVGVNSGTVIAGIIGKTRIAFDLWGQAVNIASRMESHGEVGRVQVTEDTYQLVKDQFTFDEPRQINVKGKGAMQVYLLAQND